MAKIKIVKCFLRSPGEAPTVRYVPLREFYLWKYYMTNHHSKIVEGEEISIWVDAETYGTSPPRQAHPIEPVIRVDLQYWDDKNKTATLVQRYFHLDEFALVRDTFLSHFPDDSDPTIRQFMRRRISEVKGYFIHPRLPDQPAY